MLLPRLPRRCSAALLSVSVACVLVPIASASHLRRGPTSPKAHQSHHRSHGRTSASAASHGASSSRPRAIDDARATQIQDALVKAGYLQTASGHWDDASADAMRKIQAENGWQTKLIPDSRALIKLGLGGNGGSSSENAANLNTSAE